MSSSRMLTRVVWAALAALLLASVVSPSLAAPAGAGASAAAQRNLSPNPRLERHRTGWRVERGQGRAHRARVVRREARYALTARRPGRTLRVAAPPVTLPDGARRVRVGVDIRSITPTLTRLTVELQDTRGRVLATRTRARSLTGPRWRTVVLDAPVPAGAVRATTAAEVTGSTRVSRVQLTNHTVTVTERSQPSIQPPAPPIEPPTQPPAPPTEPPVPPTEPPTEPPAPPTQPPTEPPRVLDNSVTQPALVAYGSAGHATPYAQEGALVIAGRENYGSSEMKRVSAAGGTVLVYVDPVIDNDWGRYHRMLNQPSVCGAATQVWPGGWRANEWGMLNDFRPGSAVLAKLECVLETIVAENPHIGGFFADDLGSRSWFPGFDWRTFGAQNQRDYRDGAIEASQIFRRVADRHGLVFMVNGTWQGGSLASAGGGYPVASAHGNALADGTFAENHVADRYWGRDYPCADQWADASTVTRGTPFNFAVTRDDAVREDFTRTGCYAFAATHQQYDTAEVWGPFRRTGLPSRVRGR